MLKWWGFNASFPLLKASCFSVKFRGKLILASTASRPRPQQPLIMIYTASIIFNSQIDWVEREWTKKSTSPARGCWPQKSWNVRFLVNFQRLCSRGVQCSSFTNFWPFLGPFDEVASQVLHLGDVPTQLHDGPRFLCVLFVKFVHSLGTYVLFTNDATLKVTGRFQESGKT